MGQRPYTYPEAVHIQSISELVQPLECEVLLIFWLVGYDPKPYGQITVPYLGGIWRTINRSSWHWVLTDRYANMFCWSQPHHLIVLIGSIYTLLIVRSGPICWLVNHILNLPIADWNHSLTTLLLDLQSKAYSVLLVTAMLIGGGLYPSLPSVKWHDWLMSVVTLIEFNTLFTK